MHIGPSFVDSVPLSSTATIVTKQADSPELLNCDVGAVGVGQRRMHGLLGFREVWGIVPDRVSDYSAEQ